MTGIRRAVAMLLSALCALVLFVLLDTIFFIRDSGILPDSVSSFIELLFGLVFLILLMASVIAVLTADY